MAVEQHGQLFVPGRKQIGGPEMLQVRAQKGASDMAMPESGPWLQQGKVRLRKVSEPKLFEQCRVRNIIKRTNHPGDIFERRTLDAALAERTGGLTLEIYYHEILPGVKHLAKVVI